MLLVFIYSAEIVFFLILNLNNYVSKEDGWVGLLGQMITVAYKVVQSKDFSKYALGLLAPNKYDLDLSNEVLEVKMC